MHGHIGRLEPGASHAGWWRRAGVVAVVALSGGVVMGAGSVGAAEKLAGASSDGETFCILGTVTGEGVECPAIRGADGNLYTLVGKVGELAPGETVCVCGTAAGVSYCMQGTTIAVTETRLPFHCEPDPRPEPEADPYAANAGRSE